MKYIDNGNLKNIFPTNRSEYGIVNKGGAFYPNGWAIVSSEAACVEEDILYFVTNNGRIPVILQITNDMYYSSTVKDWYGTVININSESYNYKTDSNSNIYSDIPIDMPNSEPTSISVGVNYNPTDVTLNLSGDIRIYDKNNNILWRKYGDGDVTSNALVSYDTLDSTISSTYEEALTSAYKIVIKLIISSTGGKACLTGDTLIPTEYGLVQIKDLKTNDKVLDHNNKLTEVIKLYSHDTDVIYAISLSNGETIKCTYDHKFVKWNGLSTQASILKVGDKLMNGLTIKYINIIKYDNKEIPVYEILTKTHTYKLANNIVCECEDV